MNLSHLYKKYTEEVVHRRTFRLFYTFDDQLERPWTMSIFIL